MGGIDWAQEGERFEREMYGLVRALMVKATRCRRRPYIAFGDMVDDDAVFAGSAWRSLRLRGQEPQSIGIWAIADQAVRMALGGREFRPVGRGDRCWADSPYNRRNNCEAHDLAPWHVPASHDDGPELLGVEDDFTAWLDTLSGQERGIVLTLKGGASDDQIAGRHGVPVRMVQRMKRRLAKSLQDWFDR